MCVFFPFLSFSVQFYAYISFVSRSLIPFNSYVLLLAITLKLNHEALLVAGSIGLSYLNYFLLHLVCTFDRFWAVYILHISLPILLFSWMVMYNNYALSKNDVNQSIHFGKACLHFKNGRLSFNS